MVWKAEGKEATNIPNTTGHVRIVDTIIVVLI